MGLACQAGLGAGKGSGAWPWPGWGPALRERPRLGWNLQEFALQAMDVIVGKITGSDASGRRREFRGRTGMEGSNPSFTSGQGRLLTSIRTI